MYVEINTGTGVKLFNKHLLQGVGGGAPLSLKGGGGVPMTQNTVTLRILPSCPALVPPF